MDKSLKARPAALMPHGTAYRAAICTDDCRECAPFRVKRRAEKKALRARYKAARLEGIAARKAARS